MLNSTAQHILNRINEKCDIDYNGLNEDEVIEIILKANKEEEERISEEDADIKYLFAELPQEVKDQIVLEAGIITAIENDDLIEAQERADKWIKDNDLPKTISHWQTRP